MEAAYRRDAAAVDEITRLTDEWDGANDLSAKRLVKLRHGRWARWCWFCFW